MNRRQVLFAGGAAAVVTIGAGAWKLSTPALDKASAPWRAAGMSFGDPRLNALSYAILAPNPHNRQPWQFALVGQDRIDITCDLDRRLPATDPFDRQITIGFGCMIELLRLAAAEQGFRALVVPFPDGEAQPRLNGGRIASITLEQGNASPDPLFAHALDRRSTKEPYEDRAVRQADLEGLLKGLPDAVSGGAASDADLVQRLRDHAIAAWEVEYATDATRRESIDVMRIGNDAVVAQPDGIDLGGTFMSFANAVGVVTPDKLDTPGTIAYDSGIEMYRTMIEATPAFLWLTTSANSRAEQLAAGAAWMRTSLAAHAAGIALHPWSQSLQEFPEMAERYSEIHQMLPPDGGTVQMFARAGHGPPVPASPRWPLEAKLKDA